MINTHRRWLYNKEHEARIFDAGEEINGEWYDSPAFNDPRTKCVSGSKPIGGQTQPEDIGSCPEPVKKYPSQMNKSELIKFGKDLGLTFRPPMSSREMRNAIHAALKEAGDGEKE